MMNQFLKQESRTFFMMLSSVGCVILFYQLLTSFQKEWRYPIVLASFFYMIYLGFSYYRFLKYKKILEQGAKSKIDNDKEYPFMHQELIAFTNGLHHKYLEEIHRITQDQERHRLLNAQAVHNVKLPVTTLKLLLEETKNSMDINVYKNISKEADKINEQLEQAISLYRMQTFYTDLMVVELDLYQEVNNCINQQKDNFIYHHIYPKWLNDKQVFKVLSDKKWNRVLISQIISNAIKYSALKADNLKVKFQIEQNDEHTYLHIIDEGIGIEDYDLNRVFDPFFTGENGRVSGNSSGIGLYIAKEIADRLNQNITLASTKNDGTRVTIQYLTKL